jgi:hypothetical protein
MLIMAVWKISISILEAPRNLILLDKCPRGQSGSEGKAGREEDPLEIANIQSTAERDN